MSPLLRWWLAATMACRGGGRGEWLRLPVAIKRGATMVRKRFCHSQSPGGQTLRQFRQRYDIDQSVRYAVALRKILIPLSKGMILFAQGKGGGGGKRSWPKALPPVSPWSACFLLLLARRIFSDFSWSQKYWRETHLLDPLPRVAE